MSRLVLLATIFLILLISSQVSAAPHGPASGFYPTAKSSSGEYLFDAANLTNHRVEANAWSQEKDISKYIDANNILMFVTNIGSIGMDIGCTFGKSPGFYYPYSGDINDIISGAANKTVLYSAGLMLGGKVNGYIRIAVGAFDSPEYFPGPMIDGEKQPDDQSFKVYKINKDSGPGDPDYDNWPIANGAPKDGDGYPLLLGSQTLWAVYNDAGVHMYDGYGGATDSLGVEVHQTVWASNEPGEENVVYVQYKLYNKSSNTINDFYIGFWADPDLGGAQDDLVGCDTINGIFYCYNAYLFDNVYGNEPPAWGGKVVSGPVVPSIGDVAIFNGKPLVDYKNIGMTSFSVYINGTDPDEPQEVYGYLQGNDSKGMSGGDINTPPIDTQGHRTKYYYGGNPFTGEGWIDPLPNDKRLMVNFGPLTFIPGDSQQIVLKLGAFAEDNRLYSLSKLKNILDPNCLVEPLQYSASTSAETWVTDYGGGLRDVYFIPEDSRWLSGIDWNAGFFNGGAGYGYDFWGGFLDPYTMSEEFATVELRFTDNPGISGQRAYNYLRPGYEYQGYFLCPFQAWDIDNNRQLNVCFVEWVYSDVCNQTWDPNDDFYGGREYLMIMASDYDGDDESDAGTGVIDYTTEDFDYGNNFDFMYGAWLKVRAGHTLNEIADGQKLVFLYGQYLNPNGIINSLQFRTVSVGMRSLQDIEIKCYTSGFSAFGIASSNPDIFSVSPTAIDLHNEEIRMVRIYFSPEQEGDFEEHLYITDMVSDITMDDITLFGSATGSVTAIDDNDGRAMPDKFALYAAHPNPFNSATIIEYNLPRRSEVRLDIYNIVGQRVRALANGSIEAGHHAVTWDGTDQNGTAVATGIYLYHLHAGSYAATKKMLLLK